MIAVERCFLWSGVVGSIDVFVNSKEKLISNKLFNKSPPNHSLIIKASIIETSAVDTLDSSLL